MMVEQVAWAVLLLIEAALFAAVAVLLVVAYRLEEGEYRSSTMLMSIAALLALGSMLLLGALRLLDVPTTAKVWTLHPLLALAVQIVFLAGTRRFAQVCDGLQGFLDSS